MMLNSGGRRLAQAVPPDGTNCNTNRSGTEPNLQANLQARRYNSGCFVARLAQDALLHRPRVGSVCRGRGPGGDDWHQPWTGVFSAGLDVVGGPEAGRRMVTVLAPRSSLTPAGAIGRSCREVSRVRGTLRLEDWRSLVEQSRRDCPRTRFRLPAPCRWNMPSRTFRA